MWHENLVIYEVLLRSYKDSNGDGIGDIRGLISKLDYIHNLGIGAIYLNPVTRTCKSDGSDFGTRGQFLGYDSVGLTEIDPDYGTKEDFANLIHEAHQRGIKIFIDFLSIHLSTRHSFFLDVMQNGRKSKYYDFFIIRPDIPQGDWLNSSGQAWNPLPNHQFYYAMFEDMPFLNYRNPEVVSYMMHVADYWLDMGIDGFRLDAAKYLFMNGPGRDQQEDQPETLQYWRDFRKHIASKYKRYIALIGEIIPIPLNPDIDYIGERGNGMDFLYDNILGEILYSVRRFDIEELTSDFLDSHFSDTDNRNMIIYNSTHDTGRLARKVIQSTEEKLKLLASLLLLSNGTPMIYYGDEIGLTGITTDDAENQWTGLSSMAWDDSPHGGFTYSAEPHAPLSMDFAVHNVRLQEANSASLLNHYRALIRLRNRYPLFARATRWKVKQQNPKVFSYFLFDESGAILVIHNLSGTAQEALIEPGIEMESAVPEAIFGEGDAMHCLDQGNIRIQDLQPYSSMVLFWGQVTRATFAGYLPDFASPMQISQGMSTIACRNQSYAPVAADASALSVDRSSGATKIAFFKKAMRQVCKTNEFYLPAGSSLTLPFSSDTSFFSITSDQRWKIVALDWEQFMRSRTRLIMAEPKNQSLKAFWAGADDFFWYFIVDKGTESSLPMRGGLDFILLINDPSDPNQGLTSLGFWFLPEIETTIPVSSLVLYREGVNEMKPVLYTQTNHMQQPGIKLDKDVIFHDSSKSWYFMIARRGLPKPSYRVSLAVWSAGGNWMDRKPDQYPLVETLPRNKGEMEKRFPRQVSDFVLVGE